MSEAPRYVLDDRTADLLSGGGSLTLAHTTTMAEYAAWGWPWLCLGLALGAIIVSIIHHH